MVCFAREDIEWAKEKDVSFLPDGAAHHTVECEGERHSISEDHHSQ